MNCNDTERLISAERDGALTENQRSVLEAHLESCVQCRQFRASLAAAASAWKSASDSIEIPDADREWLSIRRRLRQLDEPETTRLSAGWRPARWFGVPLGAVAALFIAAFFWMNSGLKNESPAMAGAEYVEVDDDSASVVVFVDEESGWLVVWSLPESVEQGT